MWLKGENDLFSATFMWDGDTERTLWISMQNNKMFSCITFQDFSA